MTEKTEASRPRGFVDREAQDIAAAVAWARPATANK